MFCCLRTCLNGGLQHPQVSAHHLKSPEIYLDAVHSGPEVILLSNFLRITGAGGSMGIAPLVQSKSYFEVKIQQSGCWSMGLATHQADLTTKFGGKDKHSWCLCSDNSTRHNNEEFRPVVTVLKESKTKVNNIYNENMTAAGLIGIDEMPEDILFNTGDTVLSTDELNTIENTFPDEGDIVGIAFDHVELNFYFNGKNLEVPFRNVKGTVYPVMYVGNGAILDIILDNFHFSPPPGHNKIMLEQSLL